MIATSDIVSQALVGGLTLFVLLHQSQAKVVN
jgi:hypothetical protein